MKTYIFIFEDKKGNELTRDEVTAYNLKEARKIRNKVFATSMLNDLYKIRIIKK